jgi:hypothetical protein
MGSVVRFVALLVHFTGKSGQSTATTVSFAQQMRFVQEAVDYLAVTSARLVAVSNHPLQLKPFGKMA